jgi:hypothetical protein
MLFARIDHYCGEATGKEVTHFTANLHFLVKQVLKNECIIFAVNVAISGISGLVLWITGKVEAIPDILEIRRILNSYLREDPPQNPTTNHD